LERAISTVLVTGGAGYIGSHAAWALHDAGYRLVIIDDLSTGVRANMPPAAAFHEATLAAVNIAEFMHSQQIGAVMHFAGSIVVPESVENPFKYYSNNTQNSLAIMRAAAAKGAAFIFSSTAAVYAPTARGPLSEDAELRPLSPYGRSKLMTEQMLQDAATAYGLRYVALRYFNVAGADPNGRTGQSTPDATHLIKVACQTALGRRSRLQVFGRDYDTPDGTCVRDYIHVSDLADAHLCALRHLADGGNSEVLNCGYSRGASVFEVVEAVRRVSGAPLPLEDAPRRPGDAPFVVADNSKIRRLIPNWRPRFMDLDVIVESALRWERGLQV